MTQNEYVLSIYKYTDYTSSGLLKVSATTLENPMWKSSGTLGKFVWIKQIGMAADNNNGVCQLKAVITVINTNKPVKQRRSSSQVHTPTLMFTFHGQGHNQGITGMILNAEIQDADRKRKPQCRMRRMLNDRHLFLFSFFPFEVSRTDHVTDTPLQFSQSLF